VHKNCWGPGNLNLLGLGQPHLGRMYHFNTLPMLIRSGDGHDVHLGISMAVDRAVGVDTTSERSALAEGTMSSSGTA
jgi:hypothetical protein